MEKSKLRAGVNLSWNDKKCKEKEIIISPNERQFFFGTHSENLGNPPKYL